MKKNILIAAMALLASGAALADNASGVWGGFTATATDGMVSLPNGAGGTTTVYGQTDSSATNAVANGNNVGDSFAGIAGYYSGVSASGAIAPVSPATAPTKPQTLNTIGADSATTGTGVAGFGKSTVLSGGTNAVDLSGQSVSTAESSVTGFDHASKSTGITAANGTVIGGGASSMAAVGSGSLGSASTNNNLTATNFMYTTNAGSAGQSTSAVNASTTYVPNTFGYIGH